MTTETVTRDDANRMTYTRHENRCGCVQIVCIEDDMPNGDPGDRFVSIAHECRSHRIVA